MKDDPDIVKELKEVEKLGRFQSKINGTYEELETKDEPSKDLPDQTTGFFEDETKQHGSDEGLTLFDNLTSSNTLADLLFENTSDIIACIDRFGKILRVNSSALQFSAFSEKELVGKRLWKIPGVFSKHDLPSIVKVIKKVIDGGPVENFVNVIKDKSGKEHQVELSFYPVNNNNKSRIILLIGKDVTEQRRAKKELVNSKSKIESIFDSSPNAITVTDLHGNIVECNQASLDMYGFSSKEEVLGKSAFMFIAEKDRKRALENMKKTLEQGVQKNLVYTLVSGDGRKYPGELSASVVKNADGTPVGFVAIIRDISDWKEAEKKLNKQIEELERYKKLTVGRELRMVELKKRIKELEGKSS